MTTVVMVTAWIAAAGFGFWWWRNNLETSESSEFDSPPREAPLRSLNPREFGDAGAGQLWMLRTDMQCPNATKISGRRVRGDRAISLFTLGCQPGRCSCHYLKVSDPRRQPRRLASDRRDEIRFSTDDDRRHNDDRRSEARPWSKAPYAH